MMSKYKIIMRALIVNKKKINKTKFLIFQKKTKFKIYKSRILNQLNNSNNQNNKYYK